MQFLRTVFWVVLAVIGVIFAMANWTPVTINLWSGLVVDTRLPILLLITFLLGLVPMLVLHRATRWSLRRRLDNANRALTETRSPAEPLRTDYGMPESTPVMHPPGAL
jgi:uncharacterized integral membrane protein